MATAAAKRYARAVFELAQQEGDVERWGKRLERIRELFADAEVASVLSNPTIPTGRREEFVTGQPRMFDEETTNLARLLIESGRVDETSGVEEESLNPSPSVLNIPGQFGRAPGELRCRNRPFPIE